MQLTGKAFIGYSRSTSDQVTTAPINPKSGDPLPNQIYLTTEEEIQTALDLAANAFPVFSKKSGSEKAHFLRQIAARLEQQRDLLQEFIPQETALTNERVSVELKRTQFQLELFAQLVEEGSWIDARIEHGDPDRTPVPKPDLRSIKRPLGPVVVFAASNFPLAYSIAGGDTASALAAGCPVIVKAHTSHPITSEIVAHCVIKAAQHCSMPEGVFSMVYGPGKSVGKSLVIAPEIKAVGFTGSQAGGRALMDLAAARPSPIPVFAEMSASNPVIIQPSALGENKSTALAQAAFHSVSQGVGQFCTNPGLIFIPEQGSDEFVTSLQQLMQQGEAGTMLNATIHNAYQQGVAARNTNSDIQQLTYSGNENSGQSTKGVSCDVTPALFKTLAKAFIEDPSIQAEIFGPTTLLVTYTTQEELIHCVKQLDGQLTASIHGSDQELSQTPLLDMLPEKAGRVIYNGFPTGVEVGTTIVHGGPYPATSDGCSSSVGTLAIHRFTRYVCYQNSPDALLPEELQESNPLGIKRMEDGSMISPSKS